MRKNYFTLLLVAMATMVQAGILRVEFGNLTPGDGTTWGAPYASITTALAAAQSGDELWVKKGVYAEATFILKSGVNVFGGFTGTETERDQRNFKTNLTYLMSGNFADQILIGIASDVLTTWDGFTFTGANGVAAGGAMVLLRNNRVSNSDISYNSTTGNGGAVMMTDAYLDKCFIYNNQSKGSGGAIRAHGSSEITNCVIVNNSSNNNGGGVSASDYPVIVRNCVIANNEIASTATAGNGGGIMMGDGRNGGAGRIINCTIVRNRTERPTSSCGGVYGGGSGSNPSPYLYNSIVWGNKSVVGSNNIAGFNNAPGTNVVSSAIEELPLTFTNTTLINLSINNTGDANSPSFENPSLANGPVTGDGYNFNWTLKDESFCINKGDTTLWSTGYSNDLAGNKRISGATIDLGAYENQKFSSGISIDKENKIALITSKDVLKVVGAEVGVLIQIYTLNGQCFEARSVKGTETFSLTKGMYIVKAGKYLQKIIM